MAFCGVWKQNITQVNWSFSPPFPFFLIILTPISIHVYLNHTPSTTMYYCHPMSTNPTYNFSFTVSLTFLAEFEPLPLTKQSQSKKWMICKYISYIHSNVFLLFLSPLPHYQAEYLIFRQLMAYLSWNPRIHVRIFIKSAYFSLQSPTAVGTMASNCDDSITNCVDKMEFLSVLDSLKEQQKTSKSEITLFVDDNFYERWNWEGHDKIRGTDHQAKKVDGEFEQPNHYLWQQGGFF